MRSGLTSEEFDELFGRFADSATSRSVFRWEALQQYQVAADDPSLRAFREGTPRPERSVRTSPWLARIATSAAAGKRWSRVRYVDEPLTEYVRWELLAYVESQAAGEQILVTRETSGLVDFWLFDGAEPKDRYAVLMHYDETGAAVEFEYCDDPEALAGWRQAAGKLTDGATPLNTYLAGRREVSGAA